MTLVIFWVWERETAMERRLRRRGDEGASATEYALMVSMITFTVIAINALLGGIVAGFFADLTALMGG
ncbi:hypothetical protein HMPREF0063_11796 [Aeromicrobium marinum DSM 15272]|uniref:Flp/Fap pilin component n=2 Tax=Aeromicrobium marinum TaxID=219314 RepID=E2SDL0_9ACTN|nr:hypothetical protein HMPREF0063_11796 [Aeromicrobium marinum DSM 15272]